MRRYIQQREPPFKLVEITEPAQKNNVYPMIWGDAPAYESPVTGKLVDGRAAMRRDLRESGSRHWEGVEQEQKEAQRHRDYESEKRGAEIQKMVEGAIPQMSERVRRDLGLI